MSSKSKHVVPRQRSGWAVKTAGTSRAGKVFSSKEAAVKHARKAAKKISGDLYVHGKDGTIKERVSYGNNSSPPRDRKR